MTFFPVYSCCFGCCFHEVELLPLHDTGRDFKIELVSHPSLASVLLVSGFLSHKNKKVLRSVHAQMPSQKSVIALGACSLSGGLFQTSAVPFYRAEDIVPIDVFVVGCPPSADRILAGFLFLAKKKKEKAS
ncbi:hypothetical protein AGMMS49949_06600 [Alphaproteobacteria bacterium]|nr:hypothetical protein AGMMS49949_06600 [Alphaproteobacteria bacterium]GHS98439.1 hypothetical protein AGMMS50296_6110 [Alphaproteobacteria bacterium]